MATSNEKTASADVGWAILELMGHRRLGGYVSEQEIAGSAYLRIDIPRTGQQPAATQFYSGAAVYAITPTTQEIASAVAESAYPAPVQRWELPALKPPTPDVVVGDDDDGCARYEADDDEDDDPYGEGLVANCEREDGDASF